MNNREDKTLARELDSYHENPPWPWTLKTLKHHGLPLCSLSIFFQTSQVLRSAALLTVRNRNTHLNSWHDLMWMTEYEKQKRKLHTRVWRFRSVFRKVQNREHAHWYHIYYILNKIFWCETSATVYIIILKTPNLVLSDSWSGWVRQKYEQHTLLSESGMLLPPEEWSMSSHLIRFICVTWLNKMAPLWPSHICCHLLGGALVFCSLLCSCAYTETCDQTHSDKSWQTLVTTTSAAFQPFHYSPTNSWYLGSLSCSIFLPSLWFVVFMDTCPDVHHLFPSGLHSHWSWCFGWAGIWGPSTSQFLSSPFFENSSLRTCSSSVSVCNTCSGEEISTTFSLIVYSAGHFSKGWDVCGMSDSSKVFNFLGQIPVEQNNLW